MQKLFVFLCFLIIIDLRRKNNNKWLNSRLKTDLFIGELRSVIF
jgi:hypothetical protein